MKAPPTLTKAPPLAMHRVAAVQAGYRPKSIGAPPGDFLARLEQLEKVGGQQPLWGEAPAPAPAAAPVAGERKSSKEQMRRIPTMNDDIVMQGLDELLAEINKARVRNSGGGQARAKAGR